MRIFVTLHCPPSASVWCVTLGPWCPSCRQWFASQHCVHKAFYQEGQKRTRPFLPEGTTLAPPADVCESTAAFISPPGSICSQRRGLKLKQPGSECVHTHAHAGTYRDTGTRITAIRGSAINCPSVRGAGPSRSQSVKGSVSPGITCCDGNWLKN